MLLVASRPSRPALLHRWVTSAFICACDDVTASPACRLPAHSKQGPTFLSPLLPHQISLFILTELTHAVLSKRASRPVHLTDERAPRACTGAERRCLVGRGPCARPAAPSATVAPLAYPAALGSADCSLHLHRHACSCRILTLGLHICATGIVPAQHTSVSRPQRSRDLQVFYKGDQCLDCSVLQMGTACPPTPGRVRGRAGAAPGRLASGAARHSTDLRERSTHGVRGSLQPSGSVRRPPRGGLPAPRGRWSCITLTVRMRGPCRGREGGIWGIPPVFAPS